MELEANWPQAEDLTSPTPLESEHQNYEPSLEHESTISQQSVDDTEMPEAGESEADSSQHQEQTIKNFYESIAAFSAKTPDFQQALQFLVHQRDQQLKSYARVDSRFGEQKKRAQKLEHEALELLQLAETTNRDPAELVYQMAKDYGFGAQNYYQQINNAQQASRSLTASSGYPSGQPVSIEVLADMSENDFAKWYWNNQEEFRKIMGGR